MYMRSLSKANRNIHQSFIISLQWSMQCPEQYWFLSLSLVRLSSLQGMPSFLLLFSLLLILGRLGTLSSLKSPPQKPSWLHHHAIPLELTPLFLVVSRCPLSCLHFTIPPSTSNLCPDSPFVFPLELIHSLSMRALPPGLNNSLTSRSFSLQFTPHIAAGWSS